MLVEATRVLGVAVLTWVLLVFFGFPWRFLLARGTPDALGARSALLGLGVLTGTSWTWLEVSGRGLHGFLLALTAANIVPFALATRGALRERGPLAAGRIVEAVGLVLAGTAVFTRYFADALRHHALAASLGNNDLPLYALASKHALTGGFGSKGPIYGFDLGGYLREDYTGAFTVPASVQTWFGIAADRSLLAVSLLALLLIAASFANVCRTLGLRSHWLPSALGVLAVSSSTFFYVEGEGFFAQLLGMAVFAGLLDLVVRTCHLNKGTLNWAASVEGALLMVGLLCLYPHMALLGPPVLVGAALVALWVQHALWSRSTLSGLGTLVIAALMAVVLVPTRVVVAWHRTFDSASALAGWTLPRAQLTQILGVQRYPEAASLPPLPSDHAAALAAISWRNVFLVALIGGVVALLLRRHSAPREAPAVPWSFALLVVPLTSYYVVYGYFGRGYQQWKWMLFVQPVVLLAMGVFAVSALSDARSLPDRLHLPANLVLVGSYLGLTLSLTPYPHMAKLLPGMEHVRSVAEQGSRAGVNIEVSTSTPLWDAMWLAYYFSDRPVRILTPSYFPAATPDPAYPTVRLTPQGASVVPALG